MTDEQPQTEDEQFEDIHYCPMCESAIPKPLEADEDDVKEYFRCVLSGRVFEKEFKFLDGEINIILSDVPLEAMDLLMKESMQHADEETVMVSISRMKFVQMCKRMEVSGEVVFSRDEFKGKTFEDYQVAYATCIANNPSFLGSIAGNAVQAMSFLTSVCLSQAIATGDF
jgi:hypothetical protein